MTPRLFIRAALQEGVILELQDAPFHYLKNVLRLPTGAQLKFFNGSDGEWQAKIETYTKKAAVLRCMTQIRNQTELAPITLICSVIKPTRMEMLIEKATELGVTYIQPVISDHCHIRRINQDRLMTQMIEASEQSERLPIPFLLPLTSLREAISQQIGSILWADESRDQTKSLAKVIWDKNISALLIGPEGGFSPSEIEYLNQQKKVCPVHMGPLILRAETAGIALLAIYQSHTDTWR